MAENSSHDLPPHASLEELVEFFDTHDMGDHLEQMPEAHFDVAIKRRAHLVAIDEELADKLDEIAKLKQIPAEALVNAWLKEKILGQEKKA
jgi:hypothetical protein